MTLPDHLRNLPDGNFPRRSIEWMLQRIAEQYIFDPNEDHWEDGMARNVGLALAREVVRTQPATRLNEFYTFLDVVVDLSHPRH
ncbi:hypothetical protein GOV07_05380 [Candidatus Woesearchaeota archaeon]|nr:hypothetical protein [Candidatus Woesearchaeota archaeon]